MTFAGHLTVPAADGQKCVLLIPSWWGATLFYRQLAQRLADEGLTVFLLDLYEGRTADTVEAAQDLRDGLDKERARRSACAAARWLASHDAARNDKVAVIGFSLGARYALSILEAMPNVVARTSIFYGSGAEWLHSAEVSVQGHFADHDEWGAGRHEVAALEYRLRTAGCNVEFHTYPDTSHWFFESDREAAYHPGAAELAWQRLVAFLKEKSAQEEANGPADRAHIQRGSERW